MTMDINDMILTANRSSVNDTEVTQDVAQRERMMREVQAMLREMRYRSCVGQKKLADKEKTEAEKLFDRVNKELAGRQGGNEDLAKAIKERLNELHSQMMDLRDALNEAVNKTARAAEINNVNEKSLEDNKRRIEDLSSKQKEVTEELQMAEDDVAQVNDLLSMLHDSKEEYERLSAQLDGARTPLIKKVQDFAWVDSKIPLVEEAERHAALLNALAMNLSSLVADTKKEGLVDVTQSYNKIINNIKKAEEAANAAKRAANDALEHIQDQDLAQIANSLKNHSIELKEDVERLNDELNNDLKPQLEDAQKRLADAKTKKDQVKKDLETAQKNLNFTTDVSEEIDAAKRAANQANTTATQVNDALRPIKEQLDKWQKAYGDANATNDDINNALMEANKTVSMLGDTIPLLMKKLDKLQNHSVQMPNISEDISRIRQLIQQARNAASKVGVPMKFNGDSSIQVRTPPNLADLAAYTSLKFYITLPESARSRRQDDSVKQFVFYLGNKDSTKEFLGMALEGKRLRWYFNIGGSTAEVLMAEDVKSDGKFNNIVLERIMQYGQMSMSSEAEGDQRVTKANVEAGGDQGLLNLLTSNTVFYVGGYPKTFKPPAPLALPNFKGCIELETLNEEVLSLYNFENNYNLNTTEDKPCGRSKPVLTQAWVNDGAFFDGTGYCMVTVDDDSNRIQRFEQEIKLLSHNGILLLMETGTQFLCLAVRQGRLKVYYDFSGTLEELSPLKPDPDLQKVSDAEAKTLEVIIIRSPSQQVVVRTGRTVLYKHTFTNKLPALGSSYYLGGVPENKMPQKLKTVFPKQRSLKGCFRNVKTNGNHVDLKRMPNSGVSFGCDSDLLVAREAHFSGQSYLGLALSDISSVKKNFYAGFSFRTEQKSGLMFHHHDKEGACQVLLHDGHIVVRAGDREIKTQKTYNDDNSHYVAIYSNDVGMRVYMDDMLEKAKETIRVGRGVTKDMEGRTYLGGTPNQMLNNLTGCISNVFVKSDTSQPMVLNLMKAKENVDVPLDCPAASKPQQIIAAPPKQSSKPKGKHKKPSGGSSRSRNTRESCQGETSQQEVGATHFSGSSHSFLRYDALPSSLSSMPHISMSVRINSSDGLVLYVAGGHRAGAVMSLSVSDGYLLLLLDGGKRKVSLRSRRKYNDEQWHTVFIKREGERISLIVDGINAQSKKLSGGDRSRLSGPLYVGGVPASLTTPGSGGFVGCVRDLTLNEAPAGSPAHSQGTVPCFQNPLQPGAYFSGQGGHMVIDESLVLGRDLEIQLEVRPVSDSGLLLHAGKSSDQHLSLVLSHGEVTVTVNSGKGEFSTSFTPEEALCNGRWHIIRVVKKNNVLQLHVDAASEHSVGPKQNRSAGAKETVYLGGVPDGVAVPSLPSGLPSFQGCIRKASINHRPAMLSKPLAVHGAVGTQGCPHM